MLTDISSVENLVKENPLMKDIYLDLEYFNCYIKITSNCTKQLYNYIINIRYNDISDLSPLEDFLDSNTDIKYIRLYLE